MPLAVVQRVAGMQTTGPARNLSVNGVVTGNLLVVGSQSQNSGGAVTVTDSAGNTYTPTTSSPVTQGANKQRLFFAKNVTGGNLLLAVASDAGETYGTVVCYEISGADLTAPFVADSTGTGTGTALTTGTLSLGGVESIIIAQILVNSAGTFTAGSGYTSPGYQDGFSFITDEYQITSSDDVADGTQGGATAWAIIAAAFKVAGGAPAGGQPTMRRWGATPFVGGQGVNSAGGHSGRMWGRRQSGLVVPERFREAA